MDQDVKLEGNRKSLALTREDWKKLNSKSEFLHDWWFTANQFIFASSPLRITIRVFSSTEPLSLEDRPVYVWGCADRPVNSASTQGSGVCRVRVVTSRGQGQCGLQWC
jgi:hypothetical protein